jgi:hypothetical protein
VYEPLEYTWLICGAGVGYNSWGKVIDFGISRKPQSVWTKDMEIPTLQICLFTKTDGVVAVVSMCSFVLLFLGLLSFLCFEFYLQEMV